MSTAQKLIEQGLQQGREQGLQQGLVRGHAEGKTALLLQLLVARFGSVAEGIIARVRGGSEAQLDRWAVRILDARTLDDVFESD